MNNSKTCKDNDELTFASALARYDDFRNCINTAREEGIAEGVIRVARNFKNAGADIELIMQVTGLSRSEVEEL